MQQEIVQGYRLSPQQKRLWLLQNSDHNQAYRVRCVVEIQGEIDEDVLRQALRHVAGQHEILRTTFQLLPGMTIPVQLIADEAVVSLETDDLNESAQNKTENIVQRFSAAGNYQIDHTRLPLLRADFVHLSSRQHILIVSASALCADAQSLQHLVRGIVSAYAALRRGKKPARVETMQYADFAEWQSELLESKEATAERLPWKQVELSQALMQRLRFERPLASTGFQPASLAVAVSDATVKRAKEVANSYNRGLSAFLLACWQTLLGRLNGWDKVLVGVAFDGRKFEELENAIGLLSSYLPVQSRPENDLPFKDLLQELEEQLHEAHRWQEYFSWETADAGGATFFPFCFEQRTRPESLADDDLVFSFRQQDACTDRFKVKFVYEASGDDFATELQYDASLLSADDIERLASELQILIDDASARPEAALIDLELLGAEERHLLIEEFNDTKKEFATGQCIHELFEAQADQRPEAIAVISEDDQITYAELNARANQLAHRLLKVGVGPEKTVGLCLERSVNLIIGLLGILKAGGAYVPLDPGLPKGRIAANLADANARVLITGTELAGGLRDQLDEVVCLDADRQLLARESTDNLQTGITDQNLVYVIFTSGSTGRPKGVAVEHRQLANYLNAIWLRLDVATGSSFACVSTVAADLGNTAVFPPLCKGGTLHLISDERATDPEALADYCRSRPIECLKIVPSHLQALLSASRPLDILPRRRLILGGEACPWSLIDKIKSLAPDCEILNHYGPTETTVGVATDRIDGNDDGRSETVPLGRPIANAQVYILDERMREVPLSAVGEIYIGGEGVARGYINRAGSTAEKFVPNPFGPSGSRLYRTGDLARYLVDGRIEFLGRVDDQLKIHGYRIEPREIEIALRGHPRVAASVVVGREDQPGDKQLVAYIVAQDQGTIDASELRTFMKDKLPEYMTPSVFVLLKCLPLTQNGKIDRRALPAPDRVRFIGARDRVEPRNPVEATLAKIWTNVLGLEGISIHDNFFEIGGDSILSIQVIARATQAGLRLSARQLFQHQTIADLAAVAETQIVPEVRKTTSGSSSKPGDDLSYSPSDFPRAKLSQEDLNKVLARLSGSPPGK